MLVEIFALLPGTDLASLAQACTKFHHILHTDSIWRRRCHEEFGVCENLPNWKRRGMSYRELYAKMFPYRHILGLWQLTLLNVVLDGLCITGWTCRPSNNTHVHGPMQSEPSFRIRLTGRKSPTVEYMGDVYSFTHSRHMQIRKDRFSIQWIKRDHRKDSPTRLRGERGLVLLEEDKTLSDCLTHRRLVMSQEDSQRYDYCLTYRRVYLPPSHPDDLIRPGLFHGIFHRFGPMIAMLSFHGKYARVTKITGESVETLKIHLMRRIQLPDGEFFCNFNELSRVVQEIDEQVFREQQQENGTEESEGHGWQSPAPPSVGESGAAAAEEQPVPFVLPVGVRSRLHNYPRTCRMCFYGVYSVTIHPIAYSRHFPGVVILFDENHLGFIDLEDKYFIRFRRVQNTFQHVEAPSPQAFLEMLWTIQSGPLVCMQLASTLKI
ncbi:F-box only protein 31 [Myotis brandtii]|uniref:F-box only protein 31 n=1 Tax=Myotis brandtii TaxID=109478 RepID=S7MQH2_MYOBR|nr:F-box only protein 31 [Myotis brandtii]